MDKDYCVDSFCEIGFSMAWENSDKSIGILIFGKDNRDWIIKRWNSNFHTEYGEKILNNLAMRYIGWMDMLEGRIHFYETRNM